jgi:transcriptional regulator with XRE-family HTH domain
MTTEFGERMRNAREAAGLSQLDVIVYARTSLPKSMRISPAKLSRIENGHHGEDQIDPHDLEWLCSVYGADLNEVSPVAAASLRKFRKSMRDAAAGRSSLGSRWSPDTDRNRIAGRSRDDFGDPPEHSHYCHGMAWLAA